MASSNEGDAGRCTCDPPNTSSQSHSTISVNQNDPKMRHGIKNDLIDSKKRSLSITDRQCTPHMKCFNHKPQQKQSKKTLKNSNDRPNSQGLMRRALDTLDESSVARFIRQYRNFFRFKDVEAEMAFSQSIEENLNLLSADNNDATNDNNDTKDNELSDKFKRIPLTKKSSSYPSNERRLERIETYFVKHLDHRVERFYVDVAFTVSIWTVRISPDSPSIKPPLVFIHGLYPGVFLWTNMMDMATKDRVTYYIDLPGFAKSSKTQFSDSVDVNESAIVHFIEEWRKKLKIDRFDIVAHSFGCYFSMAYCLSHPQRVQRLFLIDPWGIYSLKMAKHVLNDNDWSKMANPQYFTSKFFSPMTIMRHTGKITKILTNSFVQDIRPNFQYVPKQLFEEYIEHSCNNNDSGMKLFNSVQTNVYFALHPMIERAHDLSDELQIICLVSQNSFINDFHKNFETQFKDNLCNRLKYIGTLDSFDNRLITDPKFSEYMASNFF